MLIVAVSWTMSNMNIFSRNFSPKEYGGGIFSAYDNFECSKFKSLKPLINLVCVDSN